MPPDCPQLWAAVASVEPAIANGCAAKSTTASFDEYALDFRSAGNEISLTAPSCLDWRYRSCHLPHAHIELGRDGSGNIRRGTTPGNRMQLLIQTSTEATFCRLNGQDIRAGDIAVLLPGRKFVMATNGSSEWVVASISTDILAQIAFDILPSDFDSDAAVVSTPPSLLRQIKVVAGEIIDSLERPSEFRGEDRAVDKASSLTNFILTGLATGTAQVACGTPRVRGSSERALQRALDFLDGYRNGAIVVSKLCRAAGVGERTLLRSFHDFLGMPPGHFVKLRLLNTVRRALQSAAARGTITSLLADYNVTEFGRFAGEYKALFGETPSQTYSRQRAGASFPSH